MTGKGRCRRDSRPRLSCPALDTARPIGSGEPRATSQWPFPIGRHRRRPGGLEPRLVKGFPVVADVELGERVAQARDHRVERPVPDEASRGGTDRPARLWAAAPEVDPSTYKSLLKALPYMALLMFDRDMRVQLAVSGALASPAWPRELVGRMVWEVLATERSQQALDHCRAALAGTGGPVELSVDGLLWRGEVVPVLDAAGTVTGGLVVAVDDRLRPPREREALQASQQQFRLDGGHAGPGGGLPGRSATSRAASSTSSRCTVRCRLPAPWPDLGEVHRDRPFRAGSAGRCQRAGRGPSAPALA